ncbi:MAG: PQQ-binding-like beta-propeller repeat protein, partial [Halioglobus sp.]|nr:PQQ-binding-like beta-propeller repeat protein [Halioglobus sp.]
QKNGRIYALDAQDGRQLWTSKPGAGGKAGGVHFGLAVDPVRGVLYVPISDRPVGSLLGDSFDGEPNPSLHAYDVASGERLWETPAPGNCRDSEGSALDGCYPGFSAAVTVTPELVFAPTLDGALRAFDAASGEQLWSFDTRGDFPAINGGHAQGGAIDVGGALLAGGQLFVVSGYGQFGQLPGNAFMVFEVAGTGSE